MRNELIPKVLKEYRKRNHYSVKDVSIRLMEHDIDVLCKNIYNKITTVAKDLVKTGEEIEKKYGIPIVNKRISVTPIGFVGSNACKSTNC